MSTDAPSLSKEQWWISHNDKCKFISYNRRLALTSLDCMKANTIQHKKKQAPWRELVAELTLLQAYKSIKVRHYQDTHWKVRGKKPQNKQTWFNKGKIVLHKSSLQAQLLYKHLFAKFSLSKSQPNFQSLFFFFNLEWGEVCKPASWAYAKTGQRENNKLTISLLLLA